MIITAIVLGFAFTYKKPLEFWPLIFILNAILVLISFIIHEKAHKYIAKKYGAITEHRIWEEYRYGIKKHQKLPFKVHLGVILPIIVAIISSGKLVFAATNMFTIQSKRKLQMRFPKLSDLETAKIAFAGPLANITFSLILAFISTIIPFNFKPLITINNTIAISNMLPIPRLDGGEILAHKHVLYVLTFLLTIFIVIFMQTFNILLTIIAAFLLAFLVTILYYYKIEYQG